MRVLFLGAGKRLSLLEAFQRAAAAEDVPLQLFAAELDATVPVAAVAEILPSPRFAAPEFGPWLLERCAQLAIDLVIPNMDAATVVLSALAPQLQELGCWAVVSQHELCVAMEDKCLAEAWFRAQDQVVPERRGWPRILKRRRGFAARGQAVVADAAARAAFLAVQDAPEDFIEQTFVPGPEYSVDAYVDREGRLVGAMPRQRLKVLDGEVDESLSRRHARIEAACRRLFDAPGWQGPLTAQFIDGPQGPVLIEVNPRFGGGATHAIHCGLDMPRWLLRERLGLTLPALPLAWTAGSHMVRCRRDIFL